MKILFLISTLQNGGAERVCALMASRFAKEHEVCLAKFDNKTPFFELDKKVRLVNLSLGVGDLGILGNLKKRFGKIFNLRAFVKKEKFDAVISFLDSTNILALLACFGLKTPLIISEHTSFFAPKPLWLKIAKRAFYPLASGLSVLTKQDKSHYEKYCKNVAVVHNPLFINSENSLIQKENLVLFIGRLIALKNCEMFVKIAINLRESAYKFVVCGDGEQREKLEKLAKENNANVEFMGNVKDIDKFYKKAKFLLSTSKVEGLGNALIEAMAFDTLRIATKTSGACELINDGIDGVLCEIDDEKQMSMALSDLIKNEEKAKQICKNARARLGEFTQDAIYEKWCEVLKSSGVSINQI
ncbi:MAG: glycosyltransferase [Campylobacter sp.]|nr:glycosyltransferase [Campylobacter sp.]